MKLTKGASGLDTPRPAAAAVVLDDPAEYHDCSFLAIGSSRRRAVLRRLPLPSLFTMFPGGGDGQN